MASANSADAADDAVARQAARLAVELSEAKLSEASAAAGDGAAGDGAASGSGPGDHGPGAAPAGEPGGAPGPKLPKTRSSPPKPSSFIPVADET